MLLKTGDDSMAVAARRSGFGSPKSMRRAFVRHLGVTPGAYRSSGTWPARPSRR
ncbi:helix-turn-helix domain-containing protein [Streptomyces sp. NPDC003393]